MNYIVFDLEFNQGYSDLKQEIIEIGAVKLNENLEVLDTFSKRIKPQFNKKLDWRTKKVLKITQEELSQGIKFENAISKFKKWIGNDYILCSWALDDVFELINNSKVFELDFQWINKFIDIQELYSSEKAISLTNAILELRIPFKFDFHEALNDAMYTVKVFQKLDYTDLASYIKTFEYIEEVENKRRVKINMIENMCKLKIHCPKCGRFTKKEGGHYRKRSYIVVTYCLKCNIKVRNFINIKTTEDKSYKLVINNKIKNLV